MSEDYYDRHHHGDARFACDDELGPMIDNNARPAGLQNGIRLAFTGDEPCIGIGSAGAEKFTRVGAYQALSPAVNSIFILDVGGQYQNVTWHWNLAMGRDAYSLNANKIGLYDFNHPLNLLAILKPDEHLFILSRLTSSMMVPDEENAGINNWVGLEAARWFHAIKMADVLIRGETSVPAVTQLVHKLDSDDEFFKAFGRQATQKQLPYEIPATLIEMYQKKKTAEKEWGAVIGYMKDKLAWASDPMMIEMLSGKEDYLAQIGNPDDKVAYYLAVPGEMTDIQQSYIRLVTGVAMLHAKRAGQGARPLFYLEEAAVLSGASFIKTALAQDRKHYSTHLVYQALGQLETRFGRAGAQEIMANCGIQQYLGGGIREEATARMISELLGRTSSEIDDPTMQADRRHRSNEWMWRVLNGEGGRMAALRAARHERSQSRQQQMVGRHLRDPSQILRLPRDEQFIIPAGKGMRPILCNKLPEYFRNPALMGRYGPDPIYGPSDRVKGVNRRGRVIERPFIRERAPSQIAHRPNVSNGEVTYVKGYKTW